MGTLHDKRALVTGGSRGIGAAIAQRLAREGAHVALTYQNSTELAEAVAESARAHGVQSFAIQADCADAEALTLAVDKAATDLGGLDILVNNAGIFLPGTIDTHTLKDFDRTYAVNIRAPFVAVKAALRHLPDGGRIINIGSCNGDRIPIAGGDAYAMSKTAIVGLTRILARDLGPRRITVNTVQPGPVDTDMNPADGEHAKILLSLMALDRYGTPDEVAGMVTYLAGPEASFITGASLNIDGGFSV